MIQLKIRTEGSFGKTFAPIPRLIERLKAIGCTAAGIVDENTWMHIPWFKACKAADIQPILGVEIVVDDDDITNKMWFLASTTESLAELYKFTSKSHLQKISTRSGKVPRLYKYDVLNMSKNIFKFAGEITDGEFLAECGAIIDLSPASRILNAKKKAIAQKYNLLTVEVSDNAFAFPEDKAVFELISRAGTKQTPQYILETLEDQGVSEDIAELCAGLELPMAPMVRAEGDLEQLCREGIIARQMVEKGIWNEEYEERMQYELELIRSKDFESYFIIVADMINFAKKHMLVGPGRGSSAGSLICYLTRITEIDPIPNKLYFERFIDVSRTDYPDIDTDFPDNKRHIIFEYMAEKYGNNNIGHIGTISQFRPKSALIQVCKALHIPPQASSAVKYAIIERPSADIRANNCLEDTFQTTKPGQDFIEMYPNASMAALIEGHASHTGVHAAGLLICNDEISNYATIDADGIAHIEKNAAESIGLLKIDVLGLRTLSILEDSGINIDWYNLSLDDKKTYDVFNEGRMCGIFQFEGNALRGISKKIKFETIDEIDAVTALGRPGPMGGGVTEEYCKRKNGAVYDPIHCLVEEHLRYTYGLPVYQEQTMAIVREIGIFNWKDTNTIRKAMGKSMGGEFFNSYYEKFKTGALNQGIEESKILQIWSLINSMGSYGFNKAHSYSYAVISYWTAYLKAHFPLEFAAANLRNSKDEDSAIELLREMVQEGIEYVAFDIEHSLENWSVQDGKLIGGFTALKGIGQSKAQKLIIARDAGKLTDKQKEDINNAKNVFADIFPLQTKYKHLYDDPNSNGIASKIVKIVDLENIQHGEERVFIAELLYKNLRNSNEEVLLKKRGGHREVGQIDFVDVRLKDDTGVIGGRVGRFDFQTIGRDLLENVPVGAHILVRAKFFNGIRYAFIVKFKRIDQ